jgi:hypothetical protein
MAPAFLSIPGLAGGDIQDLPSQAWWFRERFTR